jgi:hypothetical protein
LPLCGNWAPAWRLPRSCSTIRPIGRCSVATCRCSTLEVGDISLYLPLLTRLRGSHVVSYWRDLLRPVFTNKKLGQIVIAG